MNCEICEATLNQDGSCPNVVNHVGLSLHPTGTVDALVNHVEAAPAEPQTETPEAPAAPKKTKKSK